MKIKPNVVDITTLKILKMLNVNADKNIRIEVKNLLSEMAFEVKSNQTDRMKKLSAEVDKYRMLKSLLK